MNEATPLQTPKSANRVWVVVKRILAAIVILIATIGLALSVAGLVGVWVARGSARDTVTALSTALNGTLAAVDQALARVGARADQGRQALARVNNAASKLGDRIEEGSPALNALASAVRDDLAPKIADTRAQAATLRDGVVSVNAMLETLNRIPFIAVPTLTDKLSTVSERVEAAQSDTQELRAAITEARAGASANLVAAVTARTIAIDNGLAQIQAAMGKQQATLAQRQQQVSDLSDTLLRAINLLVLLLTVLFLVFAAGQVLLIYVCWQYIRAGRFPSLRVARG
jgi:predicted  nucleic acid-binding Zn-ribbon protein